MWIRKGIHLRDMVHHGFAVSRYLDMNETGVASLNYSPDSNDAFIR